MAFYITKGYRHAVPGSADPAGSIMLCAALPMHALERRQPAQPRRRSRVEQVRPAHETNRLFDPQLYLATLSANQAPNQCAHLSSYPWFEANTPPVYDSGLQTQSEWRKNAVSQIAQIWRSRVPNTDNAIRVGVESCVDLQVSLGCEAIILPAPLTHDASTSYDEELRWLDAGLTYARSTTELPVIASIAITDACLRYTDPDRNSLLDLIADAISARGFEGAYLVVEQGSEPQETRLCSDPRVLSSVLHLTHLFARDCDLRVIVNFFGAFGAVTRIAGATTWACGWYKSLHRLRFADQGAPGRAFPTYWTRRVAIDINLENDFDQLVSAGLLPRFEDRTPASAGLLDAAARGVPAARVAAWAYSQSNVAAATEHFFHSAIALDTSFTATPEAILPSTAEAWLASATSTAATIANILGPRAKTRTNHVQGWLDAVRSYRRLHSV